MASQDIPVAHLLQVREYYWKLEKDGHNLVPLDGNHGHIMKEGLLQKIDAFKGMSVQIKEAQCANGIDGDVSVKVTGYILDKKNPTNRRGFLQSLVLRPQEKEPYYMIVNDDFFEYTSEWPQGAPVVQEEDLDTELGNLGFIPENSAPLPRNEEEVERGGLPIHVSDLPRGVTKEMLLDAFGCYGPVNAVKVVKKKTYGFVNFQNAEHAQQAIKDGRIDIGGRNALISAVASKRMIKWDP